MGMMREAEAIEAQMRVIILILIVIIIFNPQIRVVSLPQSQMITFLCKKIEFLSRQNDKGKQCKSQCFFFYTYYYYFSCNHFL